MSTSARAEAIEALSQAEHLLVAGNAEEAAHVLRDARERLTPPRDRQFARLMRSLADRSPSERKRAICIRMTLTHSTYHRLLRQFHAK